MKVLTNKTTKTNTVITWSASIQTDEGVQFAAMHGTMDNTHPLGKTELVVHNHEIYDENVKEVSSAYEQFKSDVTKAAGDFVGQMKKSDQRRPLLTSRYWINRFESRRYSILTASVSALLIFF